MPRGGYRPGAGRKKGTKEKQTLEKEQATKILRELVLAKLEPMVTRQIEHSLGIKFMMVRQTKGGKWTRVTQEMAEKGFDSKDEVVEVFEKDPSIQAFADLFNRALGRPAEQPIQLDVAPGGILERLIAARKRANG